MCIIKNEVIDYIKENKGTVNCFLENYHLKEPKSRTKKQKVIELKRVADIWIDKNGYYVPGFETEKIYKPYAIKGTYMNKVIRELFYISLTARNNRDLKRDLIENSGLKTELNLFLIICNIINVPYEFFIFNQNQDDILRKEIQNKFRDLTNDDCFWEELESLLDKYTNCCTKKYLKDIYLLLDDTMKKSKEKEVITLKKYDKNVKRLALIKNN